jgi:hypothetical protein
MTQQLQSGSSRDFILAAKTMSDEQLFARIKQLGEITAGALLEMAIAVDELDRRGHDMTRFKSGVFCHFRGLAEGRVLPEVVIYFVGNDVTLRAVANTAPKVQHEIMERGFVAVCTDDGRINNVALPDLRKAHIDQAYDADAERLLSPGEQYERRKEYLKSIQPRHPLAISLSAEQYREAQALARRLKCSISMAIVSHLESTGFFDEKGNGARRHAEQETYYS